MKLLPIGIQTFSEIVTKGYLYIDKTRGIADLLLSGKYFFLSRPRRFGKSLLLSTIKEIFQGNKVLFKDLWIEANWDWNQKQPVVHIGFSSLGYQTNGLIPAIENKLHEIARFYDVNLETKGHDLLFKELLVKLHEKHGQVVILIDEYDKPIIDYLGKEINQALAHQQILRTFYSVIKDSDAHIQFLLITGISKFSKVSLFSELNNLYDLTLAREYADLLGITESEIDHYLSEYLIPVAEHQQIDRETLREKIKEWYNGYSWDGKTFVYNPFSFFIFLRERQFRNFWFESGTPTFLLKLMKEEGFYQLEKLHVNESSFAAFDIENLRLLPILFQTGYLTIKEKTAYRYLLDYPNQEVRLSMYQYIMGNLMHQDPAFSTNNILDIQQAFLENDIPQVIDLFKSLFARIPYDIFIANQEAYYHSLLYITFQFLGSYTEAEVHTHRGRIDAVVHTLSDIFILEFKLDEPVEAAIAQIHERAYYKKYTHSGKKINLLGISFSSKEKSIADWRLEVLG